MNRFLRDMVLLAHSQYGWGVIGACDGYRGLVNACRAYLEQQPLDAHQARSAIPLYHHGLDTRHTPLVRLEPSSVEHVTGKGGTILGSSRCEAFQRPEVRQQVGQMLRGLGVSALVVCGGDGSLTGAARLAEETGLHVIGVPASIDNDLPITSRALGFATAVANVVSEIRLFESTAASHHRVMVLETMGRNCGQLALHAALTAGTEIVVIPERGLLTLERIERIARRIYDSIQARRRHALVLVAEGVRLEGGAKGAAHALGAYLSEFFSHRFPEDELVEVRVNVLGHSQRGGVPVPEDELLAARLAQAAWAEIDQRSGASGAIGWHRDEAVFTPFGAAAPLDPADNTQRLYLLQKLLTRIEPAALPHQTA
jgi:6-phosphofructokinase 1